MFFVQSKSAPSRHFSTWRNSRRQLQNNVGDENLMLKKCLLDFCWKNGHLPSLKLTVRTWKMMVKNTRFLLGWPIFRCYISFRECNFWTPKKRIWRRCSKQVDVSLSVFLQKQSEQRGKETRTTIKGDSHMSHWKKMFASLTDNELVCLHGSGGGLWISRNFIWAMKKTLVGWVI